MHASGMSETVVVNDPSRNRTTGVRLHRTPLRNEACTLLVLPGYEKTVPMPQRLSNQRPREKESTHSFQTDARFDHEPQRTAMRLASFNCKHSRSRAYIHSSTFQMNAKVPLSFVFEKSRTFAQPQRG